MSELEEVLEALSFARPRLAAMRIAVSHAQEAMSELEQAVLDLEEQEEKLVEGR